MWQYRQVFKILTDMTNTKLSTIAYVLDYDISYISKWNSGKKLPSSKNIYTINRKLAPLFARALVEEEKTKDFLLSFDLKNTEFLKKDQEKGLEILIYKLLNESYAYTNTDIKEESPSLTNFIFKTSSVEGDLKEILDKLILENRDLDIWATFDITSPYAEILIQSLKKAAKNVEVSLHLVCKKDEVEDIDLLKIITDNSSINMEFYERSYTHCDFILIKGEMYIIIAEREDYSTLTSGRELDTIFEISSFMDDFFDRLNKIIVTAPPQDMANTNYRKYFYSDNEFLFLSNYGFEFLLPNEIIDKILENIDEDRDLKKKEIEDIKLLWEELFVDAKINFLTTRTSLLNYFETGNILYCSTKAKLSPQEIESHLKNIIKIMENNENINFYIINDNRFLKSTGLDKFNFFINENNMFFKKIQKDPLQEKTSIVTDIKIHNKIQGVLRDLIDSPYSKKYGVRELEKLFAKYADVFKKISDQK
ncbi:MAG: hypothetical protein E6084_05695 [Peptoniphilus harei]|nr:hypothetical protein [Peptoniphilus harei]